MEKWFIVQKNKDKFPKEKLDLLTRTKLQILYNRDIVSFDDIRFFFESPIEALHDANLFNDMHILIDRLEKAKRENEKVVIVGDYDVDGIMSTSIFYKAFKKMGLDVSYRIPHRINEGYGLNNAVIDDCIEMKAKLIVTCDNGVMAFDAIDYANENGIDVFVTDHHEIREENGKDVLPNSIGIIDPKRSDTTYPFDDLCGGGIAFKISIYLLEKYDLLDDEIFDELISFAAMATICDVVSLVDENRIIVTHGLLALRKTTNKGLNELIKVSNIEKERIDTYHIGYILGPRFNSGGRLDTAHIGVKLLTTNDTKKAKVLASELNSLNEDRKIFTEEGIKKANEILENEELKKTIVLYLKGIHESVAGIIAGRLKEEYYRPTIVLTDAKEGVKGSGRSIEGFDIFKALIPCDEILNKYGGHPMACGLSLDYENIEKFREIFESNCNLTEEDYTKSVFVDAIFPLEYADMRLLDMINAFRPFGKSNEEPLFSDIKLKVIDIKAFGKNRNVLKVKVMTRTNTIKEFTLFERDKKFFDSVGAEDLYQFLEILERDKLLLDITYYPKLNTFRGVENVEIIAKNYRFRGDDK